MSTLQTTPEAPSAVDQSPAVAQTPVAASKGHPETGRVGVRISFVVVALVLITSGVLQLAGEHLFPPSFDPSIVIANFLADIRAMLAILAGLLVLNIASMIK